MELFEFRDGRVFPSIHALLIEPFKEIWDSDPDPKKGNAEKLFRYTELMCSPKKSNPFFGYPEADRPGKVKMEVYGDPNKATTEYMMRCVIKFKELLEHHSPSYPLLIASLKAHDALVEFLNTVDLTETTTAGGMKIKPADVTRALKEIPDVVKAIYTLLDKVDTELNEAKTRKDREIGDYER